MFILKRMKKRDKNEIDPLPSNPPIFRSIVLDVLVGGIALILPVVSFFLKNWLIAIICVSIGILIISNYGTPNYSNRKKPYRMLFQNDPEVPDAKLEEHRGIMEGLSHANHLLD